MFLDKPRCMYIEHKEKTMVNVSTDDITSGLKHPQWPHWHCAITVNQKNAHKSWMVHARQEICIDNS